MKLNTTLGRTILAFVVAASPLAVGTIDYADVAYAKSGGGEGNGGGHDGGGRSGEDHGRGGGSSDNGKSSDEQGRSDTREKSKYEKSDHDKSHKISKETQIKYEDDAPALRSLNRNYHAYLNSKDPRIVAVAAYAKAYAEFEIANGIDAVPTDPELSDEALREALVGFTKDGVVTDDMLAKAKSVLGVGPEVGKIDQIRETLVVSE
ncbi:MULTISPECIES: hypothetical protein [unclassified Rhizobium]|uniref:hypothetical protein n=1 Tax=unclassified Rhizobium TaxID=2613769 RepID=UPI0006FC59D6|nr:MULTISPECIES: hypothetical protein [unclassified Rhizobium]KQV36713.1 hypothetical protein ASC86_24590 [Rhizobium sp. Root1212]KRD28531.1 hypothetical protein ASE37_24355 [Rhizobium sp. Root268]